VLAVLLLAAANVLLPHYRWSRAAEYFWLCAELHAAASSLRIL
jgi:hypothetical protein